MRVTSWNTGLSKEAKAVIRAFQVVSFTFRSIQGLAKDAGLTAQSTQQAVSELMARSLVDQVVRKDGLRFFLTQSGRTAAYNLEQNNQVTWLKGLRSNDSV